MMNFYIFNKWKMEYHSEKELPAMTLKSVVGRRKKERGFLKKAALFCTLAGESSVLFAVGQAIGRVGMLDDVARQGE